ncbi:MAG: ABC transporter substrate-binding protein [Candidatus Heimdallarchaeaceae archaeon]
MSRKDKNLNKAIVYVLVGALVITVIFSVMMFAPHPPIGNAIFTTTLRYYTRGTEKLYYNSYAQTIIQDVKEIGVEVTGYQMDAADFLDSVVLNKDYDLAILEIEGTAAPHLESYFREGGSLNVFNFRNHLDNRTTENLLNRIRNETNFYIRQMLFYDLQEHLMKDFLPMVPLFTPVRMFAYWDNLEGFSAELGLSNSLPYMYFNGLHTEQSSTSELKVGIGKWFDLNPLTMSEDGEKTIVSLIMDKMITLDSKGTPTKNGLIDNWEYVNQTTLLLHIRNGIRWQPDVDNLYTNNYFNVNDVIFTLDLLRSPYSNLNYEVYSWIKDYGDYNSSTVYINIDSNSTTAASEPYAFALEDLSVYPFPDHYLNSGESIEKIVQSERYAKFGQYPFGTGKYFYDAENSQVDLTAILKKFDNWHGVGVIPNKPTNLVIDTVETLTVDDSYSMALELQDGSKIDLVDFGKDPAMVDSLNLAEFKVQYKLENSLIFLAFNLDNPIFGKENNFIPSSKPGVSVGLAIRRALASVIDKTFMNNAYHKGQYNVSESPVSRYFTGYYYSGITTYDYDVAKALEYLQQAGFNISVNSSVLGFKASFDSQTSYFVIGSVVILSTIAIQKKKKVRF